MTTDASSRKASDARAGHGNPSDRNPSDRRVTVWKPKDFGPPGPVPPEAAVRHDKPPARATNREEAVALIPPNPPFRAFLPILCAVWADGLMEDDELRVVEGALGGCAWADAASRERIRGWLDPARPPAAALFARSVALIRAAPGNPVTLAQAGLVIAEAAAGVRLDWRDDAVAVLARVEVELGIVAREALLELVGQTNVHAAETSDAPSEGSSRGTTGPEPQTEGAPNADPVRDTDDSSLVAALAAQIRGGHPEIRARVRHALARPELQIPDELPRDEHRERTLAAVQTLADLGLGALSYPERFGGTGEPGAAVAAFEELALGDLGVLVKYGVQFGLFGGSVAQLGTEKHHCRYLGPIATLELPGCYAMTETGHGSNVRDLRTTATWDAAADGFIVHTPDDGARKDYIGNAACHGRLATVFARLIAGPDDHGVHALLVPIRDSAGRVAPGVRIEDCGGKAGLNGVDNGRIWFDGVRVGRDALLDRFARITPDGRYESPIPSPGRRFFTMLGTLVAGRISIAAASHTVARRALAIAVRRAVSRRQFGPRGGSEVPILEYPAVQRALLPKLAATWATGFAIHDLTRRFADSESDPAELEVRAAGLKAVASRLAMDTLQSSREVCGGAGYLTENRFAQMRADTDVFTTFEGANPVLLQLVAKGLLSRLRRDLGDLSMWGMTRHLADLAGARLAAANPLTTRRTDADHLTGNDFQLWALRCREERLLRSAARRVKAALDGGSDSFAAVNACQHHLISLARAHVDRIRLEVAGEAVERMEPSPARELLARLIALFGLSVLERHRAWFLEKGYFEPPKSEAVRRQVNALCRELAPRAVELVNAFGIPDGLLRAEIGGEDGYVKAGEE